MLFFHFIFSNIFLDSLFFDGLQRIFEAIYDVKLETDSLLDKLIASLSSNSRKPVYTQQLHSV